MQRPAPRQSVHHPDVGQEELRRPDDAPFGPLRERGEEPAQARVHEDLEVLAGRRRRDPALAGDGGVVDELGVRQRDRRQEVGERAQAACEPRKQRLLLQVALDVRAQRPRGRVGEVVPRQVSVVQHPAEVEGPADLGRSQPEEVEPRHAPRRQVRGRLAHRPRARARHREDPPAVLGEPADLFEQRRRLSGSRRSRRPGRADCSRARRAGARAARCTGRTLPSSRGRCGWPADRAPSATRSSRSGAGPRERKTRADARGAESIGETSGSEYHDNQRLRFLSIAMVSVHSRRCFPRGV